MASVSSHALTHSPSHSFGYECQKRSNLVVLAKDTVAFAAGNLVQLLALSTQEQTYIRTLGGGGVGALAVRSVLNCLLVLTRAGTN